MPAPYLWFCLVLFLLPLRPPGHHAERDLGGGYCLFNNVAVAALHALKEHSLSRVAIIDFDVHHGNGVSNLQLQCA
jgi:acetoin utilization deacetylase AcuC-like enzyme